MNLCDRFVTSECREPLRQVCYLRVPWPHAWPRPFIATEFVVSRRTVCWLAEPWHVTQPTWRTACEDNQVSGKPRRITKLMILTHWRNYDNLISNVVLHQIHKYGGNLPGNHDMRDGDRGSGSSHGAPGKWKQIHMVHVRKEDRPAMTILNLIPCYEILVWIWVDIALINIHLGVTIVIQVSFNWKLPIVSLCNPMMSCTAGSQGGPHICPAYSRLVPTISVWYKTKFGSQNFGYQKL